MNPDLDSVLRELADCGTSLEQVMAEVERRYIALAMQRAKGNITNAARALGVHRNTLHNKRRNR